MTKATIRWQSGASFIFAASAAAVGLGNIWRFPYLAGQNGGGAFVLIYIACVVILGIPLLVGEIMLGRIGRANPARALADIAARSKHSRKWGLLGFLTILTGFLILTYYTVISGWVLDYCLRAVLGHFTHLTASASLSNFLDLKQSHWQMLLSDTFVFLASWFVLILGIKKGLEKAILFLFPALFILLLILLAFSIYHGQFARGFHFLFAPRFSQLTPAIFLQALGQAFFSLNIAMGVTIMFSAYLPESSSITGCAIAIAIADTVFALLAGLIVFPIVFANHLAPAAGPSLTFISLPIAFGQIPFGDIIAALFFLMLLLAAFTSVVSLLETAIEWGIETFKLSRKSITTLLLSICWLLSLCAIGSFSHAHYFSIGSHSYYHSIDIVTANIMLPIGGLLIAIFCGWFVNPSIITTTLGWNIKSPWFYCWRWIMRYFAPIAILLILLSSLKLL